MKKGDIVKIIGDDEQLYVIIKGPYECHFVVSVTLTDIRTVVDLYGVNGIKSKIAVYDIKLVERC